MISSTDFEPIIARTNMSASDGSGGPMRDSLFTAGAVAMKSNSETGMVEKSAGCVSTVMGEQTILRAELRGAMTIGEHAINSTILVDNQQVVTGANNRNLWQKLANNKMVTIGKR